MTQEIDIKQRHEFEGHMYVISTHLNNTSTKFSFTKGRVRDTKRSMRLHVDPNDLSCHDRTIFRYVQVLPPLADRFYTYTASMSVKKPFKEMQLGRKV